jgi:hypothetical protein
MEPINILNKITCDIESQQEGIESSIRYAHEQISRLYLFKDIIPAELLVTTNSWLTVSNSWAMITMPWSTFEMCTWDEVLKREGWLFTKEEKPTPTEPKHSMTYIKNGFELQLVWQASMGGSQCKLTEIGKKRKVRTVPVYQIDCGVE